MKVSAVKIHNILGVEDLEIKPGSVTVLAGANATGKTSVLSALRTAFDGSHDATLLRQGAEEGEIVLVLDDGTTVTKTVTQDASSVSVRHPQFGKISKPATYLKKLSDALALNPVAFLTAPAKERVDLLLKAVPMTLEASQLDFVPVIALQGISLDAHALEVISKVGKAIFDLRTGVNRDTKTKRTTAEETSKTLPPDAPEGDWNAELEKAVQADRDLRASAQRKAATIRQECAHSTNEAKEAKAKREAELLGERDARIQLLREEFERECQKVRDDTEIAMARVSEDCADSIEEAEEIRDKNIAEERAAFEPAAKELATKIGEVKSLLEQHTRATTTREYISRLNKEADAHEAEAAKLTAALQRLELLKANLLAGLPIEGVEIKDGDIYLNGVPFDRSNEAKQTDLAIRLAELRAGSLGLIACDGLEHFDSKRFQAFVKRASKSKCQFVVAKVTDDETLSVSVDAAQNGDAA